jgi:hypothetical protein
MDTLINPPPAAASGCRSQLPPPADYFIPILIGKIMIWFYWLINVVQIIAWPPGRPLTYR